MIITSANITADMRITGDSIQKDPYFAMTHAKSHPDSLFVEGFFCVMYHKTGVPRSGRDVVGIYGETGEGGVKIAMK